jgi:outer membrane protein assembly factor BamA
MTQHVSRARALLPVVLIALGLVLRVPAARAEEPAKEKDPYKSRFSGIPFFYYSPETKLAFGAGGVLNFRTGKKKETSRTSSVWIYATYTLAKQYSVMLKPEVYLKNNSLCLYGNIRYDRSPQNFYGIGNDTPITDGEKYTPRTFAFLFGVKRRVAGPVFGGLQFEFEQSTIEKIEPGGMLASGQYTGSEGGMLAGVGASLDWDTRDAVLFPRHGVFFQIQGDSFGALAGSDFTFSRVKLDLRDYIQLGPNRVLVLQGFLLSVFGDPPFYKLGLLGGDSLLRGYYKGRFRDKGLALVQAEFRTLISERIGVVGFAGVANVYPGFGEFKLEKLKYSIGTGLRYVINREGATLRLDLAWGKASFGLYATAQEAF